MAKCGHPRGDGICITGAFCRANGCIFGWPEDYFETCTRCAGSGWINYDTEDEADCPDCGGVGHHKDRRIPLPVKA